jgi:Protein of unknown function (DUF3306)
VAVADGFLGRWSQRKLAVREGKPLAEPPVVAPKPPAPVQAQPAPVAGPVSAAPPAPSAATEEPPPVLSLDDVEALKPESDYAPFVSRSVAPDVRNAAMKKLFTDPHYNVMDRLDTYIEDYSLPSPLPESMLRQMASAKFLNLFEEDNEDAPAAPCAAPAVPPMREDADAESPDSVAHCAASPNPELAPETETLPVETGPDHDHTDLRLQPNHAARPQEPGCGAQ